MNPKQVNIVMGLTALLAWVGSTYGIVRFLCYVSNSIVSSPGTVPSDGAWHGGEYTAVVLVSIGASIIALAVITGIAETLSKVIFLGTGGSIKTVYHGTRIPMATIVEHGIPGLSYSDRLRLFRVIGKHITELGLPIEVNGAGTNVAGVFVATEQYRAQPFALMAPAYVSDAMFKRLEQMGVTGSHAEYIVLAILDRIGSPKILQCEVPTKRLRAVTGNFGLVLDNIYASDITSVELVEYKETKADVIKVPRELTTMVEPVIKGWWNNQALPAPATVPLIEGTGKVANFTESKHITSTTVHPKAAPSRKVAGGFLGDPGVIGTTLPKPREKKASRARSTAVKPPKTTTRSLGYKATVRVSYVYHRNLGKQVNIPTEEVLAVEQAPGKGPIQWYHQM